MPVVPLCLVCLLLWQVYDSMKNTALHKTSMSGTPCSSFTVCGVALHDDC